MSDIYLELIKKIKDKQVASDSEQQDIRRDIKRIADDLKKQSRLDSKVTFDAAICYYISGYYFQAYELAKNVELDHTHHIQKWIFYFLAKEFNKLREETSEILKDVKYLDVTIQGEIENEGLSSADAIERIITVKVGEGLQNVISFIETGNHENIAHTNEILRSCQNLLFNAGESKINWWVECLKAIMDEFVENSLWPLLKPMQENPDSSDLVSKYIIANYKRDSPVVELWRSQVESLPKINDPERCSFCISVPTSGGKTKVAELAVLRFLLDYWDEPDAKCVYLAPLRKLCDEVQTTFSKAFSDIQSARISSFYGSKEVDVFDNFALKSARLLIVTPEKLDGMLRQHPNLASQIKLVIADEGHLIGDSSDRGYKYRSLLERLIYALGKRSSNEAITPRILLISGVLPNVEDFAELISGDRRNVVKIDWRPVDEPKIGIWMWNGSKFNSTDTQLPVPLPFQVSNCISEDDFEKQVVMTAIQSARQSETMVFSANKKAIDNQKFLNLLECIITNYPSIFAPTFEPLPSNLPRSEKFRIHYALLEHRIAIHHGSLPRDLKSQVEKRIDKGLVRLLFASPTLAQGVNIPFDTILIYRLQHEYLKPISDAVFWNVVGRVGRPIAQKKKSVANLDAPKLIFMLNKASAAKFEDQQNIKISRELQDRRGQYQVASPFLSFLNEIRRKWNESPHGIANLINELAEKQNLQDILGDASSVVWENQTTLDGYLKNLDAQLFALLNTALPDFDITLDMLQQSAKDLVDLLVKATDIKTEDLDFIRDAVLARIRFVAKNIPKEKRYQDYLLGLPYDDCQKIKEHTEELLSWYQGCVDLFRGNLDVGMTNFVNLLNFVADLSICQKGTRRQHAKDSSKSGQLSLELKDDDKKTIGRKKLFASWLNGMATDELSRHLRAFESKEFSEYKEWVIDQGIAWGMSAIARYLNGVAKERQLSLSTDLEYLPAFIKYGVNSKVACQLRSFQIPRKNAFEITRLYIARITAGNESDEFQDIFQHDFWNAVKALQTLTDHEIEDLEMDEPLIARIHNIRERYKEINPESEPEFPPFSPEIDEYYV